MSQLSKAEIAQIIINGVACTANERSQAIINNYYATTVVYSDPLTLCRRRLDLLKMVHWTSQFFSDISVNIRAISTVHSDKEAASDPVFNLNGGNLGETNSDPSDSQDIHDPSAGSSKDSEITHYYIDSIQTFTPAIPILGDWLFKLKLRVITKLKVIDRTIVSHEDTWSFLETFTSNLPFGLGRFYKKWCRSMVVNTMSASFDIYYGIRRAILFEYRSVILGDDSKRKFA